MVRHYWEERSAVRLNGRLAQTRAWTPYQPAVITPVAPAPVYTVVALDYSAPSRRLLPDGSSRLAALKVAFDAFLLAKARKHHQDRVAVIIFGGNAKATLLASWARPSASWLAERFQAVGPSGQADVTSAVGLAVDLLARDATGSLRRLVLVSVGGGLNSPEAADAAARHARRGHVAITAVGLATVASADGALLKRLAEGTPHGSYTQVASAAALREALVAAS